MEEKSEIGNAPRKRRKLTSEEKVAEGWESCEMRQNLATARRRAKNRWSALEHRVGVKNGLKKFLGAEKWCQFIAAARDTHQEAFLRAFVPENGRLCCVGDIDGTACPHMRLLWIFRKTQQVLVSSLLSFIWTTSMMYAGYV